MHFTVLYVKEDTKLEDISLDFVEQEFGDAFCDCCGEREPEISGVCDWFQIGGRWCDALKATRGIKGDPSWCCSPTAEIDAFSISEIADLDDSFLTTKLENLVYAIATPEMYVEHYDKDIFKEMLDKIITKQIKGVVALVDCHY